mgnify:CR=1 FL=1
MKNKYAIILGNLGNTRDRFCPGYKVNPSSEEMLKMALQRMPHIQGIELVGTWDIRPDNVKDMKKRLDDAGVACVSIIPDTFANPRFGRGSITSIDAEVRKEALAYLRQMSEVALEMDCGIVNLWLGQDGYDYLLTTDYDQERDWLTESTKALATEFPTLRYALEYKPKEPRNFSMPVWPTLFWQQKRRAAAMWVSPSTRGTAFMRARLLPKQWCWQKGRATCCSICTLTTITAIGTTT